MPKPKTFTAPRDGVERARLELPRGAKRLSLCGADIDELVRAEFDGVVPRVSVEEGTVVVAYPRRSLAELVHGPTRRAEITLAAALPWTLAAERGVGDAVLDLSGVPLRELEIAGGVSDLRVRLPQPKGAVPIRILGGASNAAIRRPSGAAAVLRIRGGASRLVFDDERYGALGGETRLASPDAGGASDRFEIEISGGASRLTVVSTEEQR